MQIGKLTERPEVLTGVPDGALHLALFPTRCRIAGTRVEAIFASKGEKARQETDQPAIVFGHGGGEIVIGHFSCDAAQRDKSVHVAADKSLEALAVSELQIEHAAV